MYTFVTSFSENGYETYAKKMLESIVEKWNPKHFKLIAYYHDFDLPKLKPPTSDVVSYRNLNDVKDMLEYRERMKKHDGTEGGKMSYNWRLDAIKWCHKVYSLTDLAFEMMEDENYDKEEPNWLIWIDADTIASKRLDVSAVDKWLPSQASVVHLGRTNIDYSETSFMGFNLQYHDACSLLADFRGCYTIGETIAYREWHDGFIFERLLNIYKAHGMAVNNMTENVKGLTAFMQSPLSEYFIHYKGNLKDNISNTNVSPDVKLERYRKLCNIVEHYKVKNIVEVGTWNGGRAIDMADAAFKNHDSVNYIGFDLFEDATEASDDYEMNTKPHNSIEAVKKRLTDYATEVFNKGKTFTFQLHKGDSKLTIPKCKEVNKADFAFIDGGHSYETVKEDYKNLKKISLLVFDDYFSKDQEGNLPKESNMGVNKLIKEMKAYGKVVLPSTDRVFGGGITHICFVANKKGTPALPKDLTRMPIVVNPKDSRPKQEIIDNIHTNQKLIKDFDWLKHGKINKETAFVVSGGSSTNFKLLKEKLKSGGKVFCVKHSYPKLLAHGIQPFACVILDPRPIEGVSTHGVVRKDLFKTIDDKTLFLIASMTDPSVTRYLQSKNAKIKGWQAYSDALRDASTKDKITIDKNAGIKTGTTLVAGGTCAAMRTISLAHILGFRYFELFGFDCSVKELTPQMKKEKISDKPKYFRVETSDKHFWTTGELLANAQDCEKLFDNSDLDLSVTVHGEGTLVSEVYKKSLRGKEISYLDIINPLAA